MAEKRIGAAIAAALCALYIRASMPALYRTVMPALREALALEQLALPIPADTLAWLRWE